MTIKKYRKKELIEAEQFNYIDGIDGKETCKLAEKLGISRNSPHSVLWEMNSRKGWELISDGDYIVYGKSDVYPCKRELFEATYGLANIPEPNVMRAEKQIRKRIEDYGVELLKLREIKKEKFNDAPFPKDDMNPVEYWDNYAKIDYIKERLEELHWVLSDKSACPKCDCMEYVDTKLYEKNNCYDLVRCKKCSWEYFILTEKAREIMGV